MAKFIKRFLALILIAVSLLSLIGCTNDDTPADGNLAVMTYKDKVITASEFGFYLAKYKARFAEVYSDFDDTDEFYDREINGVRAEELLFNMVVQNVKRTLISEVLFEERGLKITDDLASDIEYYIDDIIYEKFSDDEAAFESDLNKLGITDEELFDIYLRDEMTYELMVALSDDRDEIGAGDDGLQEYLERNYARIYHIYVNNKYTYLTDASGNPVYDDDGKKVTVKMTGEELDAKNAIISAIDESLEEGGNFLEVHEAFSEDKFYENGYYLTKNTQFVDEVVRAAFELEVGEWIKVESSAGTHYVMRFEMDEKPWKNSANSDFLSGFESAAINELFGEYLDSFATEVTVNEEALEEFDLRTSPFTYIF
ncbi:MAG: hypothetical protein E7627_07490 [Ruminococcaceae bacterium]|nr:hypothetical protein [Oscillospiraceae bacterium]